MPSFTEKRSESRVENTAQLPFNVVDGYWQAFPFLLVFFTIFEALKLNQYIFYHYDTSPAVILIPAGIAVAAIYLKGYRMWAPIALGWFFGSLTSPAELPLLVTTAITVAYSLQALVGGYLLKRLNFQGTLGRIRCALIIVLLALALPVIAPSITTTTQWLAGSLAVPGWTSWSRAWAGGVLNIMVFTPLITTWYKHRTQKTRREFTESSVAIVLLVIVTYLAFWIEASPTFTFLILYLLFAILFWIGLRMHPRITVLALFLIATLGMAGTLIAHPSTTTLLNSQLLSDELFIVLIAPVFYILTALVEERRQIAQEAGTRALELEEANRKLSLEDQAKNVFLAMLAHELRNPLAPVISSLDLLKIKMQDIHRPDLMQLVEVAESHSTTVTLLLDDLLDISRISQKKFKLQKESVELHAVIEQTKRTFDVLHKHRNHTLVISMPNEHMWIEADPLRLEQIIVNLLNNAAKYTKPGGRIELSIIHDKGKDLSISIKDNGIGIQSHMFGRIFEKFIQSDENNSGLGIGLWLTKRLVELHGGNIWVESEGLGKGANFTVLLPATKSVQLPLATSPRRHRKSISHFVNQQDTEKYNILVVDDNEAAATGLSRLLLYRGHTVRVAHTGSSAIEIMRNSVAEIVLLDIGLSGMDGYQVAKKLREDHGNLLTLIALTGYGQEEVKENARKAGFNYHLIKPVGIADVEAVLAKKVPPLL